MDYTIFLCPNCKRRTKEMKLLKCSRYNPLDEDINIYRFPATFYEILRCKCGRLLTWFEMIEAKEHINEIGEIKIIEREMYGSSYKLKPYLGTEKCPECGSRICIEEGCITCHFCGFTKCG